MVHLSQNEIAEYLRRGDEATTKDAKGTAFEDLVSYIFGRIPGITIHARDKMDFFKSDEIDIGCRNDRHPYGLADPVFPFYFPIEGKNWEERVGSKELAWFDRKLQIRCISFGIIVAANGITGDKAELSGAHQIVADALSHDRRIILLKRKDIEALSDSSELVELIKKKLCELLLFRTCFS